MVHYRDDNNSTVFSHHNHVTSTTYDVDSCKNIEKIPRSLLNPKSWFKYFHGALYRVENNSTVFFHQNHDTHTTFWVGSRKNIEKIPVSILNPKSWFIYLPGALSIGQKIILPYFPTKIMLLIQLSRRLTKNIKKIPWICYEHKILVQKYQWWIIGAQIILPHFSIKIALTIQLFASLHLKISKEFHGFVFNPKSWFKNFPDAPEGRIIITFFNTKIAITFFEADASKDIKRIPWKSFKPKILV